MRLRHWTVSVTLLLLAGITAIGVVMTRDSTRSSGATASPLVDDTPLKTARSLAPRATTPDEQRFAQEAARLADHEVDLAFADALREAAEHPVEIDPELRQRILRAQAAIAGDQSRIDRLRASAASASPGEKERIQKELDLLEAQKALDDDELEDARQDLIRAGGDPEGTLQRLREEHQAGHESQAPQAASPGAPVDLDARNLAGQVRAGLWLRDKRGALEAARDDAERLATSLSSAHDSLEQHVDQEKTRKEDTRNSAASRDAAPDALSSLKHFSDDQKSLSGLDQRILDERELAAAYGGWIDLVRTQERAVQHGILESLLWILLIALFVYTGDQFASRSLAGSALQKKGVFRLRAALRLALQAIGALLVVCIVLGVPNNPTTVFGLAGAGLTVALKDFIVGFFGWFVLMGRNGIQVGDWVEINGVVGEVIEIGILRTVLMETGNWTDTGHPTGRKVAFVNSFAIEGHFFNFSTAGQWLWDELQVLVPPGQNPYALVDAIQNIAEEESRAGATVAEREWHGSEGHDRLHALSVAPAIQLRPTSAGMEVHVRYITSAHERYATRSRMYQRIVSLLHAEMPKSAVMA
jgi:small-conductance mechanosensitive channel